MKILVMSDSHGKTRNVHKAIQKEEHVDMIIHLGDKYCDFEEIVGCYDIQAHGVVGNIDYFDEGPSYKLIDIEGKKVFISHGHRYKVNHDLEMLKFKAKDLGADIVLYGHSHVPYIEDGNMYIMNPGSISEPRTEKYPSYALLEISKTQIRGNIIYIK